MCLISFKKVGEVFEIDKRKYICLEVGEILDVCKECAFKNINCTNIITCIDNNREDNKDVYFKELSG